MRDAPVLRAEREWSTAARVNREHRDASRLARHVQSTSRSSTSATSDDDATGRKSESAAAARTVENGARTPRATPERATRLIASGLLPIRRDALAKDDAIVDAPTSAAKTYEGCLGDRTGQTGRKFARHQTSKSGESRERSVSIHGTRRHVSIGQALWYTHDIDAYRKSKPSEIKGSLHAFANAMAGEEVSVRRAM